MKNRERAIRRQVKEKILKESKKEDMLLILEVKKINNQKSKDEVIELLEKIFFG